MPARAGRVLRVSVATASGGVYNVVVGIRSATMSRQGLTVDVSTLTDADIVRILGQRDCSYRLEGNWEDDATGQNVIRDSLANDTALFARFLPTGTTGFQQEVKVGGIDITGETGPNKVGVSIELQGSGAITSV